MRSWICGWVTSPAVPDVGASETVRVLASVHRLGRALLFVGLALVLTLLAAACSDDSDEEGASTIESTPGTEQSSVPGVADTPPADAEPQEVRLTPIAQGGSLTAMAADPATGDLYLAERAGQVVHVDPATGDLTTIVDISADVTDGRESGLLGIAFSPDGDRLYLSYSDLDNVTTTVEFPFVDGEVDPAGQRMVFRQEQPFGNHNGGNIAFGPDGYLYIGLGDGGSGGDPLGSGQDLSTTLGAILRIDPLADCASTDCVDGAYAIPADNPFVGGEGVPEIWAFGVRNPWRFSFDTDTGDLWVGDVGQNSVEEVTFLPSPDAGRGANLGWALMEANAPFRGGSAPPDHVGPIVEYANDGTNCSVTGGFVYRGEGIPFLDGVYLYGDYCAGNVLGVRQSGGEVAEELDLGLNAGENQLASFGQDADGEVYVLTLGGTLYRIDAV